ncbi:MAG TPA: DUF308 domain-containing protein [Balneolaceae bacterium]|nr:DUF308 domain-containing protein [Balneolaceae bacterium]
MNSSKWYIPLILGIIFILVGIWVFFTPVASFVALSILFAFTFLLTGILEIIYAYSNQNVLEHWGWSLAAGIIELLIGILLLAKPEVTIVVLPLFVGFAILFRSGAAIGWSIVMKRHDTPDWGGLMILGILGLILALIMLWNPIFAGLTIVFYTAFAFIAIGVFQVYRGLRLK